MSSIYYTFISIWLLCFSCFANAPINMSTLEPTLNFTINNKILAQVNNNTISVLDLMKQMDLFFYSHNPELRESKTARYQFYISNWKPMLNEMIHTELILADAKDKEVSIPDGEIRKELESRFGPNVMAELEKINLTYQEVWELIRKEMTVDKMKGGFIYNKVLQKVTPQTIKNAYHIYCDKNPPKEHWKYLIISIRSQDNALAQEAANKIHDTLSSTSLEEFEKQHLTSLQKKFDKTTIQISSEFDMTTEEMAKSYKTALQSLKTGCFSSPQSQLSRATNKTVYRIFYLKDYKKDDLPSFNEIAQKLKNELLNKELAIETENYFIKLRKRFNFSNQELDHLIAENFEPFLITNG